MRIAIVAWAIAMRNVVRHISSHVGLRFASNLGKSLWTNRGFPNSDCWYSFLNPRSPLNFGKCFSLKIFDKNVVHIGFDFIDVDGSFLSRIPSNYTPH